MSTTQQLATLRNRQTALLHDLASRGKPKTPAEHQVCMEIARELDAIQGEIGWRMTPMMTRIGWSNGNG